MTEQTEDKKPLIFMPNGKWAWVGIYVPEESDSPEDQEEFVVYADDMETAVRHANETIPSGTNLVYIARSKNMEGVEIPVSDEIREALEEAQKRSMN
jgi:hypothetical protein